MSHSFNSQLMHCVFSMKERRNLTAPKLAARLYPYIGGIARENKIKFMKIGGVFNHVHLLISLPSTVSISKVMQLTKGNSSKWVHDSFPEYRLFEWQQGYGAFSIGIGDVERTTAHIENQAEHIRKPISNWNFYRF
ncbi:MAG: IS200/IS605 family transposase [Acidobacteriota bacterium]|nr:IS200/IS605 family transposase [Acidobacteriota bacterium]